MARASPPIRRRLMAMMLLTSAAAIVLTCSAFLIYELIASRRQSLAQIATLARVVAANSTAALAFRDDRDAAEVLATLHTEPNILAAALYDARGELFALYMAEGSTASLPVTVRADGYGFSRTLLEGFEPVSEQRERRLGTLYICSDTGVLYERLTLYAVIAAGAMGASLLLAFALSHMLQGRISRPILSLVGTARAIAERGDYAVRAPVSGEAEFRLLTMAFNQMLARIEEQNAALKSNAERLRAVLNAALSAVVVMDAQGVIIDWNPRAEALFGWPRHEAVGRMLADTIVPARDREAHRRGLARFLSVGSGPLIDRTVETWALRRDGVEFMAELSISVMNVDGGATFCGFVTDITERKEAQRKLQNQLARLDLLQRTTRAIGERQDLDSIFKVILCNLEDNLPINFGCICVHDAAAGKLTVVSVGPKSAAQAQQLGVGPGMQLSIAENGLTRCVNGVLVYEPDLANVPLVLPQQLAAANLNALVAAPLVVENRIFGVLLAARSRAASFSSGDCEFLRQLSEHVALAAHQVHLYTQLQKAYEELQDSQQTILQQERLRALGQMASGIAHDINNAISPVTLYVESLLEREQNLSERARNYLRIVQRSIDDVGQTVARMREFYRQRERHSDLTPLDLNPLVEQVLALTRARWSDVPLERGVVIDVRTELAAELPKVLGTESDIRDALTNLIFNAVDAMAEGGTLLLRTRIGPPLEEQGAEPAPSVQLEVVDTGSGMDEQTRRRCLEPFFTTKGERGTGMGLSMVYGMVKRHGAQIEIDSIVGHGTTVRVRFIAAAVQSTAQVREQPPAPVRPLRLLVVDDEPLILQSLSQVLSNSGHTVVTANGGQAGIEAFSAAHHDTEAFDLVITDLGMPYVDGRAVAAAVKALSPSTPVILLTGWGQRLSTEQSVPQHVDRLLSKPPKLSELHRALAELTTGRHSSMHA